MIDKIIKAGLLSSLSLFLLNGHSLCQQYLNIYSNNVGVIEWYDSSKIPAPKHIGTGTLMAKFITPTIGYIFIVTNKHNLPEKGMCKNIYFRLGNKDIMHSVIITFSAFDNLNNYSKEIKFAKEGIDIALIDFTGFKRAPYFNFLDSTLLNYKLLATNDTLSKYTISIGSEIFFLGYPSFFYDKRNSSPIVRGGVIASNPRETFYFNDDMRNIHFNKFGEMLPEEFKGFLIDANVFGGSSGSIVVSKTAPELKIVNGGLVYVKNPSFILGIATNSYFDLGALDPGHIRVNLGAVISSNLIKETIDTYFK